MDALRYRAGPPAADAIVPKSWWLKRLAIAGVAGLVLLGFAWWLWAREADRRIAAVIADAKAQGRPVLGEVPEPPNVPDADNALRLFSLAASSIVTSVQRDSPNIFDPLPPREILAIKNLIQIDARALRLARQASTRPSDSWSFANSDPKMKWRLRVGDLSRLLNKTAVFHHQSGDDAEALGLVRDLLRLADSMGSCPDFISHLISQTVQLEAYDVVRRIVVNPQPDVAPVTPAIRQQILGLIALLLRDDQYRQADARSVYRVRDAYVNGAKEYESPSNLEDAVLAPMYKLDLARRAARYGLVARALESVNRPVALPADETYEGSYLYKSTRLFSNMTDGPSMSGALRGIGPTTLKRHVAAISLAILLYRSDHQNRLPTTLDDLVPMYLPAVPRDESAADGRTLSYVRDHQPPFIHTVKYNGTGLRSDWAWRDDVVFPLEPPPVIP